MSFAVATKDSMLNAVTTTVMGAHSGFPGGTGANELSGTGYARPAASFGASSGAIRTLSGNVNITIPAGSTVRWLSLWNGATFVAYSPNAGSPKEFIADPATSIFTSTAHGYANGSKVVIYGDTVPAGLVEGQVYFVVNTGTNTFQVSAASGGSPVSITSVGGSGCVVSTITEEAYGGGGTHTINSWVLGLPN